MWFNFKERILFWERRLFSTAVVNVTTTKTCLDVGDEINGKAFSSHVSATWPQHMCALGRFSEGWCLVKKRMQSIICQPESAPFSYSIFWCASYWKCIRSSLLQFFHDPSSDETDFYHELMRFALFTETQVRRVTLKVDSLQRSAATKNTGVPIVQSSCLHTSYKHLLTLNA